jgi:hypothetical protein
LLEELEANGVFSRDEKNVVFSRRMRRDEAVRESDRERQIRHRAGLALENKHVDSPIQ